MIDVKQAAQSASNFFASLYNSEGVPDVRLEEVELTEDGKHWLITLSFPPSPMPPGVIYSPARQYKIFKVDAQTGDVLSMKIREI
jgi:hypothetical protein